MKLYIFSIICAVANICTAGSMPEFLKESMCRRIDAEHNKCLKKQLGKCYPYLKDGVTELGIRPLEPFRLSFMSVDRTLSELVSIKAVLKDVQLDGALDTVIEDVKMDPVNLTWEIRYNMPLMRLRMEYDVNGQLLIIPLRSKGFFDGNFTEIQGYVRGTLKTIEKDDESHLKVDKLAAKIVVGDGHVNLLAKKSNLQFAADLITNFYNKNARSVMDAINPIFVETSEEFFRIMLDQTLGQVPAKEWIPGCWYS